MNFNNIKKPLGLHSLKWSPTEKNIDAICLSISDLDFETPKCITDSIEKKLQTHYFGYIFSDEYYLKQILFNWFCKNTNWKIENFYTHLIDRISQGIKYTIQTFTNKDDSVVILDPIYSPFRNWITSLGRKVVNNTLIRDCKNKYSINFELLEKQLSNKGVTMLLLCNPHNPTGRVWSENELKQIGKLCEKYNVLIVSDDAHCEIRREGTLYIPIASVCPNNKIITLVSPAKAFNTASLKAAVIIFSHEEMKQKFLSNPLLNFNISILSKAVIEGAYKDGEEYLQQLNKHIDNNFIFFKEWLNKNFPQIPFEIPEATYLAWVDISFTKKNSIEIQTLCRENNVYLISGMNYGKDGDRFIRINLGTSCQILQEGLEKIKEVLNSVDIPN